MPGNIGQLSLAYHLAHHLADLVAGESAAGEIRQHTAAPDFARKISQLGGPFGGEREREGAAIDAVGGVSRECPVDQTPVYTHREQIARETERPAAAAAPGLHIVEGEGAIIQQPDGGDALQGGIDRLRCMPLAPQPAAQVGPCERATLECLERRAKRALDLRLEADALAKRIVQLAPRGQPRLGDEILRDGGEGCPIHLDPDRTGAPGVWNDGGDDGQAAGPLPISTHSLSSSAPTTAPGRMPRSSLTLPSISSMSGALSRRKSLAFSRPWPIRWSL